MNTIVLDGICMIEKKHWASWTQTDVQRHRHQLLHRHRQKSSHLPSYSNEHDVYENHVVWSAPAMATFTDPGGLGAIMSHFGEVEAPSTHDMFKCTNYNSLKSRNYELGISFASFEFFALCPGTALNRFKLSKCCDRVCCGGILCYLLMLTTVALVILPLQFANLSSLVSNPICVATRLL